MRECIGKVGVLYIKGHTSTSRSSVQGQRVIASTQIDGSGSGQCSSCSGDGVVACTSADRLDVMTVNR